MNNLDKEFQLKDVYFYINKTSGASTPLLINEEDTCFINLYNNNQIQTSKHFPFKKNKYSPVIAHNFAQAVKRHGDDILVHRLWWLLKNTKYFKNASLIKKLKIKNLNKKSTISFKDIIEINNIIIQSKQFNKEMKNEAIKRNLYENTL